MKKIYLSLEPFIEVCKENENLIHFLLKNQETIGAILSKDHLYCFLMKIYLCDLETLGEKICDQYHQRGFFSQIAEFKILLKELIHAQ